MRKKNKPVFMHTETDVQNITTVQMDSIEGTKEVLEELKKKYETRGIPVKVVDDMGKESEFVALDFKTLADGAGDPVLHFKIKANNLILYLTTPHPDSLKCLQTLKDSAMGFPFETTFRDYLVDMKDLLRNIQQQKGQVRVEDGIHPEMEEYLKDDFKDMA